MKIYRGCEGMEERGSGQHIILLVINIYLFFFVIIQL